MSDRSSRISKLIENKRSRAAYIKAKLSVLVPSQIRALRLKLIGTQKALGEAAEMKQSRISAMERPGVVRFNLDTLVRLAAAFKVGLVVKFVPFSEMLRWENGYSQDDFNVTIIDKDTAFIAPVAAHSQTPGEAEDRLLVGVSTNQRSPSLQDVLAGARKQPIPIVSPSLAARVGGGLASEAISGSAR